MTEEYAEAAGEEQQELDAQLDQQDGGEAAPSADDLKREQVVGAGGCAAVITWSAIVLRRSIFLELVCHNESRICRRSWKP